MGVTATLSLNEPEAVLEVSGPTAVLALSGPTATARLMEIFGNWILIDGYWNDNGVWCDNVILGRNYYTDPVAITSIAITEITANAEIN